MADKHVVRFEPVGIEIEVDEEQTVLRAAAEQGIMLMHGCKEGQCAACKSFVLDGEDIELDKYSTFALPDFEKEEGFTLLCRAHVYEDVTIELLNYDEEMIRSGQPIQRRWPRWCPTTRSPTTCGTWCSSSSSRPRSRSSPASTSTSPFRARTRCGRSRWPTPPAARPDQLEFIIKVYPDGLFSHFLDHELPPGDRARPGRPVRGVHAARRARLDLVFVGGGAGMAPILSVLRSMAERGSTRKATYYYGARGKRDLCFEAELRALEAERCPNFTLRAGAVRARRRAVGRRGRLDHRRRASGCEGDLAGADCLRLRAAADGRGGHGAADRARASTEKHIYYDKFTTTGQL